LGQLSLLNQRLTEELLILCCRLIQDFLRQLT